MRLSAVFTYPGILFFCCLFMRVGAQEAGKDSLIASGAYYNALQVYHRYLVPETGLYRGSEYAQYGFIFRDGYPFFDDSHMRKGSVYYNGILYEGLPLQYDLVREQLVINDPYENYRISLINEQVDRFTIENHLFINFRDTLNPSAPRRGYYEQLYKDRIALFKKERKAVVEDLTSGKIERYIDSSISYYLKKGETWYAVNNKRSFLHALNDRNREARKFMRKNRLNFRRDKENTLLKVSVWYNGVIPNTANK